MTERIGFVGVGRMGANMARRLKDQNFRVTAGYDVNTAGAQALAQELGCEACAGLRQARKLADVLLTVVTDDRAMKKSYSVGLIRRVNGRPLINCSILPP